MEICFLNVCHLIKNTEYKFSFTKTKDTQSTRIRILIYKKDVPVTTQEAKDKGYSFVITSREKTNYEATSFIVLPPQILGIKIFYEQKLVYENNSINFFIKESIRETIHTEVRLKPD
ncbi:14678_t:CDS:1 [Racocetra persica]|uniref:14678_t:CDS:1 n=1 Tax=Racocetra persica TaxID=160502 RepID=A0ACA9M521_9GLOM|nr:14678_t:CDS:1 [Racocetra persica]